MLFLNHTNFHISLLITVFIMSSSSSDDENLRPTCSVKKRKHCGSFSYKTKFDPAWVNRHSMAKDVIIAAPDDVHTFKCLVCKKEVSCAHQGEGDLKRHIRGKDHQKALTAKANVKPISSFFMKNNGAEELSVRRAELKFTGFLAEHNLPIAAADHLGHLIRNCFPDSKIAQNYSCARTKASCLLNDAISPDLLDDLIKDMKINFFTLCVDGSNDQNLQKMNPVTVRIFDINQQKVVCKFLDMCPTKGSTAEAIFNSIDTALQKHELSWDKCIGFGVDNTSVNIGKNNSIMSRVLVQNNSIYFMGCPCHIAHNAACYASKAFCSDLKCFDVEEMLVDAYFWFDYSSKRKNAYSDFCQFVDLEYRQVLKFLSVRWLGMQTCLERVLKQFPALQSYFRFVLLIAVNFFCIPLYMHSYCTSDHRKMPMEKKTHV